MAHTSIRILEHGRISRGDLGESVWRELRAVDQDRLRGGVRPVFDWGRVNEIRAQNLVGVIEVPSASIEILPKIDPGDDSGEVAPHAADNLVTMLTLATRVRSREVGGASLVERDGRLLDAFVGPFARSLMTEMSKGLHRSYSRYREDLPHVRGRILIHEEAKRPPWARHRISVEFDELDENTLVNMTIKAAATRLARATTSPDIQKLLTRIVDELSEVEDRIPSRAELRSVVFDRQNRRFAPLFEFSRAVIESRSPILRAGTLPSFSLVVSMDSLFEEYVAEAIRTHATSLGLERRWIHPQARGRRVWLLRTIPGDRGALQLKPDIVVDRGGLLSSLVVDTKWKKIDQKKGVRLGGVAREDIYQVVSYGLRYQPDEVVLVYPHVDGLVRREFKVEGTNMKIRVASIDLRRDLSKDLAGLRSDLRSIVGPGSAESTALDAS